MYATEKLADREKHFLSNADKDITWTARYFTDVGPFLIRIKLDELTIEQIGNVEIMTAQNRFLSKFKTLPQFTNIFTLYDSVELLNFLL